MENPCDLASYILQQNQPLYIAKYHAKKKPKNEVRHSSSQMIPNGCFQGDLHKFTSAEGPFWLHSMCLFANIMPANVCELCSFSWFNHPHQSLTSASALRGRKLPRSACGQSGTPLEACQTGRVFATQHF